VVHRYPQAVCFPNVTSGSHSCYFKRGGLGQYKSWEQSMTTSELPLGPVSHELVAQSNDGEKSAGIGDLLDQVSKKSTGEVDSLIGELRQLSGKLHADGARIKRDIEQYEILSQQVMQLTKIISDSVATISNNHTPATNGRTALPSISWRKAD